MNKCLVRESSYDLKYQFLTWIYNFSILLKRSQVVQVFRFPRCPSLSNNLIQTCFSEQEFETLSSDSIYCCITILSGERRCYRDPTCTGLQSWNQVAPMCLGTKWSPGLGFAIVPLKLTLLSESCGWKIFHTKCKALSQQSPRSQYWVRHLENPGWRVCSVLKAWRRQRNFRNLIHVKPLKNSICA